MTVRTIPWIQSHCPFLDYNTIGTEESATVAVVVQRRPCMPTSSQSHPRHIFGTLPYDRYSCHIHNTLGQTASDRRSSPNDAMLSYRARPFNSDLCYSGPRVHSYDTIDRRADSIYENFYRGTCITWPTVAWRVFAVRLPALWLGVRRFWPAGLAIAIRRCQSVPRT
jgi:hypothetical protein